MSGVGAKSLWSDPTGRTKSSNIWLSRWLQTQHASHHEPRKSNGTTLCPIKQRGGKNLLTEAGKYSAFSRPKVTGSCEIRRIFVKTHDSWPLQSHTFISVGHISQTHTHILLTLTWCNWSVEPWSILNSGTGTRRDPRWSPHASCCSLHTKQTVAGKRGDW